jgi:DNA adenine methylase
LSLFDEDPYYRNNARSAGNSTKNVHEFKTQLLKWIGNKQRFAHEIISFFPKEFGNYYEPFLGSGAVLATLAPNQAVASDTFLYLIQIFQTLQSNPDQLYKEMLFIATRLTRTLRRFYMEHKTSP